MKILILLTIPLAQDVQIRPGFSGCADLVISSPVPFSGGEIAWQYSGLEAPAVRRLEGLPADGFLAVNLAPPAACPDARPGIAIAFVTGALDLPAGAHALFEVCYRAPAAPASPCGSMELVDCLGNPPVKNQLFPGPLALAGLEGSVCFLERPFRRGDVDGDGAQGVGDAVAIVRCLFGILPCPGCLEPADVNDDGAVDISDVVFLLSWRVGLIAALPPPAAACDRDPTADPIFCLEAGGAACAWAELRWDPPEKNSDGSPLLDLAGYRVYSGASSKSMDLMIDVGPVTQALIPRRSSGRVFFAVAAYNARGLEGSKSNEAWKDF